MSCKRSFLLLRHLNIYLYIHQLKNLWNRRKLLKLTSSYEINTHKPLFLTSFQNSDPCNDFSAEAKNLLIQLKFRFASHDDGSTLKLKYLADLDFMWTKKEVITLRSNIDNLLHSTVFSCDAKLDFVIEYLMFQFLWNLSGKFFSSSLASWQLTQVCVMHDEFDNFNKNPQTGNTISKIRTTYTICRKREIQNIFSMQDVA